ncbi:MAG: hypothetical protein LBV04_05310, partial [Deferribacteraceae bacterium]|nr:hypothetical protein [Deferribacteraceae bacterium]
MAINKYKNHLLIISEDDAYKDIAQGKDRVFVLCGKTNAERVKADLGSGKAESIGKKLAESCRTYSEQA